MSIERSGLGTEQDEILHGNNRPVIDVQSLWTGYFGRRLRDIAVNYPPSSEGEPLLNHENSDRMSEYGNCSRCQSCMWVHSGTSSMSADTDCESCFVQLCSKAHLFLQGCKRSHARLRELDFRARHADQWPTRPISIVRNPTNLHPQLRIVLPDNADKRHEIRGGPTRAGRVQSRLGQSSFTPTPYPD